MLGFGNKKPKEEKIPEPPPEPKKCKYCGSENLYRYSVTLRIEYMVNVNTGEDETSNLLVCADCGKTTVRIDGENIGARDRRTD